MKALVVLLILAAIGYFGYNHFLKPLTGEEQEVQVIKERFDGALEEYLQAVRKAGDWEWTRSEMWRTPSVKSAAPKQHSLTYSGD